MNPEEIPKWKYFIPFYGIYVTYQSKGEGKGKWWAASIIMTILTLSIIGGNKKDGENIDAGTETSSSSEAVEEKQYPKVGEMVKTDKFELTLTKSGARKSVGGAYLNQKASEGATFVTIQYQYKNISGKPLGSFSLPRKVQLIGPDGLKYDEDSGAGIYFKTEVKLDSKVLSDLNPGITSRDAAVFEIATESWSNPGWRALIDADDDIIYQLK